MIGQALGNDEGVVKQAGAENGAKQNIAQKAGTARQQGETADGKQVFVHRAFSDPAASAAGYRLVHRERTVTPTRSSIR